MEKQTNGSNKASCKSKKQSSREAKNIEMLGNDLDSLTFAESKDACAATEYGHVKVGENLGKRINSNFMDVKDFVSMSDGATARGTEASGGQTRLRFKDFYSDSEDEIDDEADKMKEKVKTSENSAPRATSKGPVSGLQGNANEDKKKTEETKTSSSDRKLKPGSCSFCGKDGYPLECSRCHISSYCNRECQKNDYQHHKVICRRKETFDKFQSKIPGAVKEHLEKQWGITGISCLLTDLPSEHQYVLGCRGVVMAEITGPYFHIFRYGICIRDMAGTDTFILFYAESNEYVHRFSNRGSERKQLGECIRPGNFILLLDTCWHYFADGTVGIRINHLNEVHFIFQE